MNSKFILCSLAVSFGCSYSWVHPEVNGTASRVPVKVVCVSLPHEHYTAAERAVKSWARALGQWRRFLAVETVNFSQDCDYWVHETVPVNRDVPTAYAWASELGGNEISVRRGFYEDVVEETLIHELGHCLGAQHVSYTTMHKYYDGHMYACPDVVTVAQVAAYNRVNLQLLSWCYW